MAPLTSHAVLQVVHTCRIQQIFVNKARGSKVRFFVCISVVLKKFQSKLFCVVSWCAYHLHGKPGNQMVRIIPFGVLLKLWTSGQSDNNNKNNNNNNNNNNLPIHIAHI